MFRWISIVLICLITGCAAKAETPATQPARKVPAVFAVAWTNVTDADATLVFTTSVPAIGYVEIHDEGQVIRTLSSGESEIHRISLGSGLTAGKTYAIDVMAIEPEGGWVGKAKTSITLAERKPRYDQFQHRTLLGVGHADDLELVKELGAGVVRVSPTWDAIEPERGQIDHVRLKLEADFVAGLKKIGVEPLVLLCYANPWAKTYTDKQMTWRHIAFGPPDDVADWKHYVRTVMSAMKGNAQFYEAWNEPDAGYLASGTPAERSEVKDTVARTEYRGNDQYWIGDRYVPLAMGVREVADEIDASATVLAASWNRDYHGSRGEITFSRGLHRYLQQYSIHNYVGAPHCYEKWEIGIANTFIRTSTNLLKRHNANMPLAITEFGIQSYDAPKPEQGFASRADAQVFLTKSVFYYLSLERVTTLVLHQMGYDDEWSLLWKSADGGVHRLPTFFTYQWLCKSLSGKTYYKLPIRTDGGDKVRAYALSLPDEQSAYIAIWQNHGVDGTTLINQPAKELNVTVDRFPAGKWLRETLDLEGNVVASETIQSSGKFEFRMTVPAAEGKEESRPMVWRLTKKFAK